MSRYGELILVKRNEEGDYEKVKINGKDVVLANGQSYFGENYHKIEKVLNVIAHKIVGVTKNWNGDVTDDKYDNDYDVYDLKQFIGEACNKTARMIPANQYNEYITHGVDPYEDDLSISIEEWIASNGKPTKLEYDYDESTGKETETIVPRSESFLYGFVPDYPGFKHVSTVLNGLIEMELFEGVDWFKGYEAMNDYALAVLYE